MSLDDYYQLSSGLVMLQTTNHIYNTRLYDLVIPQSLFAWQRVRVANMMAHSGREWYNVVRMYNSGIYSLLLIYKVPVFEAECIMIGVLVVKLYRNCCYIQYFVL